MGESSTGGAPAPPRIAVSGSGPAARGIVAAITGTGAAHVLLVGTPEPGQPRGTVPALAAQFADCAAVIHVPAVDDLAAALRVSARTRRLGVVAQATTAVAAAQRAKVPHLVVVTSAMVLGAKAQQPILDDDAPIAAAPDDGLVGDLLEVERVVAAAASRRSRTKITVLRPAALVGPGIDTAVTRHFEAPRLLSIKDAATTWQFLHVSDLGRAAWCAIQAKLFGPLTVAAPGVLTNAQVEQLSGMRRIEVPARAAVATAERLHRTGVLPMPANDLLYVMHPWAVAASRLRAAGWEAQHSNEQCLAELLKAARRHHAVGGRRVGGRDVATIGVAGAAVALLGTAAVWRQARARRR